MDESQEATTPPTGETAAATTKCTCVAVGQADGQPELCPHCAAIAVAYIRTAAQSRGFQVGV
jgi:hypothetical protein